MEVDVVGDGAVARAGTCKQCGQCCRRLGWLSVNADEDTLEWIRARDPAIEVIVNQDLDDSYWISFPYACRQLIELGDGSYHCGLQNDKPMICRQYPESTDELKPGCGFFFTEGSKNRTYGR